MGNSDQQRTRTLNEIEEDLQWMLDVPFFIDASYLEAFYDAVLQPKTRNAESIKIEVSKETAREISGKIGGEVSPGKVASTVASVLGANFKIAGGIGASRAEKENRTHTLELEPIHTPQRQLIQLVSSYLLSYPNRIFFVNDVQQHRDWFKSKNVEGVPREVVFLDLPSKEEADDYDLPRTMLIPMAAEFSSGQIRTFYNELDAPRRTSSSWANYIENFSPRKAVQVIENATEEEEGGIEWINFRVPLSQNKTARLHFENQALEGDKYNTGTFAFDLIHMGWKHGLRFIGTVQSEPDVRVVAGYRK